MGMMRAWCCDECQEKHKACIFPGKGKEKDKGKGKEKERGK